MCDVSDDDDDDGPLFVTCSRDDGVSSPTSSTAGNDERTDSDSRLPSITDREQHAGAESNQDPTGRLSPPADRKQHVTGDSSQGSDRRISPPTDSEQHVNSENCQDADGRLSPPADCEQEVHVESSQDSDVFESTVYQNEIPVVAGLRRNSSFTIRVTAFQYRRWLSVSHRLPVPALAQRKSPPSSTGAGSA